MREKGNRWYDEEGNRTVDLRMIADEVRADSGEIHRQVNPFNHFRRSLPKKVGTREATKNPKITPAVYCGSVRANLPQRKANGRDATRRQSRSPIKCSGDIWDLAALERQLVERTDDSEYPSPEMQIGLRVYEELGFNICCR